MALRTLKTLGQDQVDLEAALQQVVDEVVELLDADRGTLYLVDHARSELVSRVAHLPELAEIRLRLGEGIAGTVAATGQAISMPDDESDPRFSERVDSLTGYHTRSVLAVPVRGAQGSVIAVLQVLNKLGGCFTADDLVRLSGLAAELAEALTRTSLASQLRPESPRPLEFRYNHIVGESPAMLDVFRRIARAARTNATVLVRGESGTGKEVLARAVHVNSPRRARAFVKVDCAALPAQLIENELFGHERGAFTGADRATTGKVDQARGGTLFLDEVGELPLTVQGKLLRLLQDRAFLRVGGTQPQQVDVRFVCATHRDLEAEVAEGRFRQDLYYRLRVVQIDVPPLRARGAADLDRLIDHFFFECAQRHGRPDLALTPEARLALHGHGWPGNVRELEHAIESAVVLSPSPQVTVDLLPSVGQPTPAAEGQAVASSAAIPEGWFSAAPGTLQEVELAYIEFVLARCDGNRSQAARVLGIGRNTLLRKLKERGD